ncbi:Mitochondrial presequence protease [Dispira simplex]|nr:Mitochondrial presequence protease [Dispira simplex]
MFLRLRNTRYSMLRLARPLLMSSRGPPRYGNRRTLATTTTSQVDFKGLLNQFVPDNVIHGFQVQEIRRVNEISLMAVRLEHQATGAQYLHVARDDPNNVFSVGFNTTPKDNTGVSHILGHTALCGSTQYPVRDPFFKMLNRSMSTFMNAWTAHDYTQYPFATQNAVDYSNLQNVYLDAVFHPLLHPLDFAQEGWRIEREDTHDSSSPWTFKGVVYNEMKGAFSDATSLFATRAQQALYPGTSYEYVSGGDPAYITDLTHEQLVGFHRRHYHPSNARFFSYGNFPLAPQLERIDRVIAPLGHITTDHTWETPSLTRKVHRVAECGPLDHSCPEDKQSKISLGFLTNDARDVDQSFSMGFLSRLLLSGASTPMYQALIDSNLGADYSPNTGYNPFCTTTSFSVGLQGVKSADHSAIQDKIHRVFEQVARDGFPDKNIQALIHLLEMGYKHKTADFGLQLMQSISGGWFQGRNPIDLMEVNHRIAQLKKRLAEGRHFESLVERYFLNNPQSLIFTMEPDSQFYQKQSEAEAQRLQAKVDQLTPQTVAQYFTRGKELLAAQEEHQDLSCLPTLSLADIPPRARTVSLDHRSVSSCPTQWNVTATNGLSYLRAINTFPGLPNDLRPYLPLFCGALTSCGTTRHTMAELDQEIRLYTGGIAFSPQMSLDLQDPTRFTEGIMMNSHCLDANIPHMYRILQEILQETDFYQTERLRTLITGSASSLWNSVADSGHQVARTLAAAHLLPSAQLTELYDGLNQLLFLNELAIQQDLTTVAEKLKGIAAHVLGKSTLRVALTTDKAAVPANEEQLTHFLETYPVAVPEVETNDAMVSDFTPSYVHKYYPMPFASNYSSKCIRTVPFAHPDGPALQVLAKLMTTHFLHREIRERNGAYGGGTQFASQSGLFSFYSYRDPNPVKSVEMYAKAAEWAARYEFTDAQMIEAKLSLFSSIDAPLSVFEEGMALFTLGITDAMRQERREAYLKVNQDDVHRVAQQYLNLSQPSTAVILGEQREEPLPENWVTEALF